MTLPANPPHVVGIDLSLTATGLAWPNRVEVYGQKGLTTMAIGHREMALEALADVLATKACAPGDDFPALAVIENLPTGRTAGGVVSTEKGYLWHELVRRLHKWRVPMVAVAPSVIKKLATGKGNANKGAVIEATARRLPWLLTAGDENACDAAWAMAAGCALLGQPIVELPKVHLEALAKLRLPEGVQRS